MAAENCSGIPVTQDMVDFYVHHPAFNDRRVQVNSPAVIQFITECLMHRGMSLENLKHARWIWTAGAIGPDLCLILPGIEA